MIIAENVSLQDFDFHPNFLFTAPFLEIYQKILKLPGTYN